MLFVNVKRQIDETLAQREEFKREPMMPSLVRFDDVLVLQRRIGFLRSRSRVDFGKLTGPNFLSTGSRVDVV